MQNPRDCRKELLESAFSLAPDKENAGASPLPPTLTAKPSAATMSLASGPPPLRRMGGSTDEPSAVSPPIDSSSESDSDADAPMQIDLPDDGKSGSGPPPPKKKSGGLVDSLLSKVIAQKTSVISASLEDSAEMTPPPPQLKKCAPSPKQVEAKSRRKQPLPKTAANVESPADPPDGNGSSAAPFEG